MGRRGPKPRRVATAYFESISYVPEPPEHLGDAGRELWHRILARFVPAGAMVATDLPALEILCDAWDWFHRMRAELRDMAPGSKEALGTERAMRQLLDRLRGWFSEFGMTPASRGTLPTVPGEDPTAAAARRLIRYPGEVKAKPAAAGGEG